MWAKYTHGIPPGISDFSFPIFCSIFVPKPVVCLGGHFRTQPKEMYAYEGETRERRHVCRLVKPVVKLEKSP